ncbi:Senescence/spartin-associated [Sesbania bispinosa]|nr:Senescence/spartin-associated [Sesbania bispinosa]
MGCCFRSSTTMPPMEASMTIPASVEAYSGLKQEVLIQIAGCKVHLVDGGEVLELAQGQFMIIKTLDENVSLATIIKVGEDLQWPLTKDEPVVKLDALHYLFSLPVKDGEPLSYGVTFSQDSFGSMDWLDSFLKEHSCFSGLKLSKKNNLDWKEFAPKVEDYNHFLAKAIAGGTGQIVKGIFICSNAYTNKVQKGGETILNSSADEKNVVVARENMSNKTASASKKNKINKNLKRVRKLSKMTEKLSKSLLNGVGIVSGSVMAPVVKSQQGKAFLRMLPGEVLLASLDALNKVLDAAEAAEKQTFSATSKAASRMVSNRFGENAGEATEHVFATAGHAANTAWNVFKIRKAINPASSATSGLSIYKAARSIKRRDNSLYNALRSIYEDSIFVGEISQLWPQLPLLANLRCGLWYSPNFHSTCYFKSTDGHTNNCSFSTSRLNLHVTHLAGQKGGCMIVDSTRKGKRFPDSMSKTIPIWACVLNRAIAQFRRDFHVDASPKDKGHEIVQDSNGYEYDECAKIARDVSSDCDWDCSLHLPLWVSATEKASIEKRLEEWTEQLKASGADIASLSACLKKPLRPLWISQKTVIWLNEVPHHDSWDFTPIILVSASSSIGISQHRTTSEFSWNYIPGAGDDEESWARGLSPTLFWNHVYDLINSGPDVCNQKVADIVEKSRVRHAYKGKSAPQIKVKPLKSASLSHEEPSVASDIANITIDTESSEDFAISWLGSTNLAVGTSQIAAAATDVDCILNCDRESISVHLHSAEAHLHVPMLTSKFDRFSLLNNLPKAVSFAKFNLGQGKRLLVCCNNGKGSEVPYFYTVHLLSRLGFV